jgi:hypothetical protein
VAHTGQKRNACRILLGKYEGKRPPSRPRHRWDANIMLEDIGGLDKTDLVNDKWWAFVNTVMSLHVL